MRSLVSTLARIALLPVAVATATASADMMPTQPLWQFQWALDNSDSSQGVCLTVPWSGTCERDTALPVIDMDINGDSSWANTGMNATPQSGAGATSFAGDNVVIGLIDTGIDYRHPDLARHIWLNPGEALGTDTNQNGVDDGCEDNVDGDGNGYLNDCHGINTLLPQTLSGGALNAAAGDPMDSDLAHGTHMAGLMVGDTGTTGLGIRGVAGNANVKVVTCKAAQMEPVLELVPGTAIPALTQARMKQCVEYFVSLRQRGENLAVINASGGMSAYVNLGLMWAKVKSDYLLAPEVFQPLLEQLQALDVLVVGAAGNMSWDIDTRAWERAYFPAAFAADNVLSVAAINAQGELWNGSSYGRYSVDVAAPGHQILSALPPAAGSSDTLNYGVASGTSPATALVSGLAALLKASPATSQLTAPQLRHLIMASGRPLAALRDKTLSGRTIRVSDSNGIGALSCENQLIQRRISPTNSQTVLLPGDTLHLEIESFTCAQNTQGTLIVSSSNGVVLQLTDSGTGADRIAGDGVFSVDWTIPEAPASQYVFTLNQGSAMPEETFTVATTVIADNADASSDASGTWWATHLRSGYWGSGYLIAYTSTSERLFSWKPTAPRTGRYEVRLRWPDSTAFARNALFRFRDATGNETSLRLNQKINGGQWVSVGEYAFNTGENVFTLSNAGADSTVAADAIQLVWKSY